MKQITTLIVLLMLAEANPVAHAAGFSIGHTLGVSFLKGESAALPVSLGLGVTFTPRLYKMFGWFSEIGFSTGFTKLYPAPRVASGPMLLGEKGGLAIVGGYQFTPGYSSVASVSFSGALCGALFLNKTTLLVLVLGGGKTLGGPPSITLTPKLVFTF